VFKNLLRSLSRGSEQQSHDLDKAERALQKHAKATSKANSDLKDALANIMKPKGRGDDEDSSRSHSRCSSGNTALMA